MDLKELATHIDLDLAGSLKRFSNMEPLYKKYLKKFVAEPTFATFLTDIKDPSNLEAIEVSAHTMKGICGNLGLKTLFDNYNAIVSDVRTNAGGNLSALSQQAIDNTNVAVEFIKQLD